MSLYPAPFISAARLFLVQCAETRAAMSGDAIHDTEPAKSERVEAARKLAAIEHAIAKALGTTFPTETR